MAPAARKTSAIAPTVHRQLGMLAKHTSPQHAFIAPNPTSSYTVSAIGAVALRVPPASSAKSTKTTVAWSARTATTSQKRAYARRTCAFAPRSQELPQRVRSAQCMAVQGAGIALISTILTTTYALPINVCASAASPCHRHSAQSIVVMHAPSRRKVSTFCMTSLAV